MTPERWQRVSEIVHAALAREASQRASFVKNACAGDDALHQDVVSLLDEDESAGDFLERPVIEAAVMVLAGDPAPPQTPAPAIEGIVHRRTRWWIHLTAGSFLGYFCLVVFSVFFPQPDLGMRVRVAPIDRLVVSSVSADSDADRGGVLPGDRVVAIDGGRLRNGRDYRAFNAAASIGEARTYLFERSGPEFSVTMSPHRRPRFGNLRFVPIYAGLVTALILSLVVIYSRPDDGVARLGALLLASVACTCVPIWPTGLAGTWRHLPMVVGVMLWPACLSSIALGPILFGFFVLFPRRIIHRRWIWIAALAPAAVVTAWVGVYLVLVVYRPERSVGLYLPDWFATLGPLTVPAYAAVGLAMLVASHRRLTEPNERRRIRVLVCGMVAASVGVLYFIVVFISDGGTPFAFAAPTSLMAGLLFAALPVSFAYAVIAHRLFDIRILIRQGLQYAFARRSLLLLVPALASGLVVDLLVHGERPLIEMMRDRGWMYAMLASLAVLAYRRRDRWMAALDRRFFREQYDGQRILTRVIEEVRAAGRLESVAALAVTQMRAAFHSSFVALLVREPNQRDFHTLAVAPATKIVPPLTRDSTVVALVRVMGRPIDLSNAPNWLVDHLPAADAAAVRTAGVDLVAPIVAAVLDRREAVLVFGGKRSEEPYSREDREFVRAVAESLALRLQTPGGDVDTDDAFAECPLCGRCVTIDELWCADDGTRLARVDMPRVLGRRYTVQRRLGRGGMGTVYEAHDGALERPVALKVIRDDRIGSPDAAERFRREALVAASFTHPNVVTVYDYGSAGAHRGYLVMELLIGVTLGEALRRDGCFTVQRTLHVMRGVCQAVHTAHSRQLIHRDLKPDNIFLTQEEMIPKVLDFGIARAVHTEASFLTVPGVAIGTAGYMSPEQARGGTPHRSWDIWALAVVTYELLTGQLPFDAVIPQGAYPARAAANWPGLPANLDSVFASAFSHDADQRPLDALAFLHRLTQAVAGDP